MAQILADLFYSFGNCLNCFPGSPTLKINSRSFKIQRLLGEGGFSYVYLVEDTSTHELFALKKIRCPFGAESVQQAMREVDAYRLFDHVPTIISAYDHCVATERGSGGGGDDDAGKTVYVLLPYYRRGNLQDMINANLVNHGRFPERHLMMLFLGVCKALRAMHEYQPAPAERMQMGREEDQDHDHDDTTAAAATSGGAGSRSGRKMGTRGKRTEEQEQGEQERPLMEQGSRLEGESGGKIKSYAHRDIKPGNIMIDDSGSVPILMDLGSVAPSPIPVTSQSLALQIQDQAAEHSTMPYRAPELFDVRTGSVIDTKTDIWSLGCTLYACLVGKSPFELRSDETGGTLSLCVLGGDWRFPDEKPGGGGGGPKRANTIQAAKAKASAGETGAAAGGSSSSGDVSISEPIRNLVRACLKVEPAERPDINELIAMVEQVIDELPDGDFTS
ncbi:kinase-like domain-containing protein [Trichoderma longibrachiatum]